MGAPESSVLPRDMASERNIFNHIHMRFALALADYRKPHVVFALVSLALTTAACTLYRMVSDALFTHPQYMVPVFTLCCAGATALAFPVKYYDEVPAYKYLCRALATILGIYALIFYPAFGIVDENVYTEVKPLFTIGRWVAVASLFAAWLRPSFVMVPCLYVILMKDAIRLITTIHIGRTDYIPLPEMGLFLCFGMLSMYGVRSGAKWLKISMMPEKEKQIINTALLLIFVCGIAVHFANYFMSGWAKIVLDGGPLSWVLHNRTHYLILGGESIGTLPFGAWPEISSLPYRLMNYKHLYVVLNAMVLGAQLLSIAAITRVPWMIAFTLFFDVMHISIFMLTGVNFWLWVLLNSSIVGACLTIRHMELPASLRYIPALFVVGSVYFLHIAELGWYDSNAVVSQRFYAVTRDGKEYRVPPNYFLANSYAFYYLSDTIGNPDEGHFPNGPWGSNWSIATMYAGNACTLAVSDGKTNETALKKVEDYVRAHHRYILNHLDKNGRINYDLYPHHHFTNPIYFRDFKALDKRTIVAYKYLLESTCLDYDPNRGYTRDVKHKTEHIFYVQ